MEELLIAIWILTTIISIIGLILRCDAAVLLMLLPYITTWFYIWRNN